MQDYKYENVTYNVYIEDDILHVDIFGDLITEEMVDEGIRRRIDIANGKTYPILGDIRKAKMFTSGARARMSQKDGGDNVTKVAVLVNSKTQEVIFNFFTAINIAPAPSKLFANKEKALAWLKAQK